MTDFKAPWKALRGYEDYYLPETAEELAELNEKPYSRIQDSTGKDIIWPHDFWTFLDNAHAHLIAAAPELLAALEYALGAIDFDGYEDVKARIDSAINKARGIE